ncbi:MAG: hypothetical protein CM1200mP30_05190 [Pseudomonadota bacterium]|nr:MAG: hypothetical protein CM1200mP30_05190 [Pseudomonadota bacterium]
MDILGYRRYGHNESDEPRFTQPDLYRKGTKHPNVREVFSSKLVESGSLTKKEILQIESEFKQFLMIDWKKQNSRENPFCYFIS